MIFPQRKGWRLRRCQIERAAEAADLSRTGAVHFLVDFQIVSFEVSVDAESSAAIDSSHFPARLR